VTHGVDPAVKEVKTPDAAAVLDRVTVKAGGDQLRLADHTMLPSRQSGDRDLGCGHSVGTISTQ
jgi:hypothetical protein